MPNKPVPIKRRGRIYVQNEGGWQVVDAHYTSVVDFPTRREAEQAATLYRAYIRKYGNINLMSAPTSLATPFTFPPSADPRFEYDTRFSRSAGFRSQPKAEYADEVEAWFRDHPEERQLWLSYPPEERVTQEN